jgi:hypothetical protein
VTLLNFSERTFAAELCALAIAASRSTLLPCLMIWMARVF